MWLLILEALVALSILLFAVWWTMFSGRKPEDRPPEVGALDQGDDTPADAPRAGSGRGPDR